MSIVTKFLDWEAQGTEPTTKSFSYNQIENPETFNWLNYTIDQNLKDLDTREQKNIDDFQILNDDFLYYKNYFITPTLCVSKFQNEGFYNFDFEAFPEGTDLKINAIINDKLGRYLISNIEYYIGAPNVKRWRTHFYFTGEYRGFNYKCNTFKLNYGFRLPVQVLKENDLRLLVQNNDGNLEYLKFKNNIDVDNFSVGFLDKEDIFEEYDYLFTPNDTNIYGLAADYEGNVIYVNSNRLVKISDDFNQTLIDVALDPSLTPPTDILDIEESSGTSYYAYANNHVYYFNCVKLDKNNDIYLYLLNGDGEVIIEKRDGINGSVLWSINLNQTFNLNQDYSCRAWEIVNRPKKIGNDIYQSYLTVIGNEKQTFLTLEIGYTFPHFIYYENLPVLPDNTEEIPGYSRTTKLTIAQINPQNGEVYLGRRYGLEDTSSSDTDRTKYLKIPNRLIKVGNPTIQHFRFTGAINAFTGTYEIMTLPPGEDYSSTTSNSPYVNTRNSQLFYLNYDQNELFTSFQYERRDGIENPRFIYTNVAKFSTR